MKPKRENLGLTAHEPSELSENFIRKELKMPRYIAEGRSTFYALVPDRFKTKKEK